MFKFFFLETFHTANIEKLIDNSFNNNFNLYNIETLFLFKNTFYYSLLSIFEKFQYVFEYYYFTFLVDNLNFNNKYFEYIEMNYFNILENNLFNNKFNDF
jgi:hypothetical protein